MMNFFSNGEFHPESFELLVNNLVTTSLALSKILEYRDEEIKDSRIEIPLNEAVPLIAEVQSNAHSVYFFSMPICDALENNNDLCRFLKERNLEKDYRKWMSEQYERKKKNPRV